MTLTACSTGAPPPVQPEPKLDPASFFTGRSTGEATLDIIFSSPRRVRVQSRGMRRTNGVLILDQLIHEGEKAPRTRRWVLRATGPNRWSGSLTDAAGPVTIRAHSNAATIDYAAQVGVRIHQELRLRPDRKTLDNQLTATKWGIPVATLNEVIRKLD